ncbi:MAG: hypothetical protein C4288_14250 [Leptolyngbya sp. ERB_1_1]
MDIVFKKDSYLKQIPGKSVNAPADLENGNAVKIMAGSRIAVSNPGAVDPTNNHRKITCALNIGGIVTWYV